MVVLRGTKKVLRYLSAPVESPGESATALGDWYANRIVVDRQPILLLVSAKSLLAALVPANNVREFPGRLSGVVAERLRRLGVDKRLVDSEVLAMDSVVVAKTCDRSVLGTMNDFGKAIPFYLAHRYWGESSLRTVEARLAETPCRVTKRLSDCIFPDKKADELLVEKWSGTESTGAVS
jgi:hypothetical protein